MTQTKREDHKESTAQVERFRDLARQLECDEDEKAFEEKVRKVAKPQAPGSSAKG
jgi:hypothetical protein